MIWVRGHVVPDETLAVGVGDRTFEHGLGLFETFRTWNGRVPRLDRHLARLRHSATELGLPLDPADLPDAEAVAALLRAEGSEADALLRLTLSGGIPGAETSTLWLRTGPLPPAPERGAVAVPVVDAGLIDDPLARHKSLNYWRKRLQFEHARAAGADEALLLTPDGRVWEGSRTNVFAVEGAGARPRLRTPGPEGPFLPGIMRELVIEVAAAQGWEVVQGDLRLDELERTDEAFLTNAVRGVVPLRRLAGRGWEAPGRRTCTLRDGILDRMGITP